MAFVEKSSEKSATVLPLSAPIWTSRRIVKALGFLTVYALAFFALGLICREGYWVIGLWSAAAALAWVFLRGASEASLPSPPESSHEE